MYTYTYILIHIKAVSAHRVRGMKEMLLSSCISVLFSTFVKSVLVVCRTITWHKTCLRVERTVVVNRVSFSSSFYRFHVQRFVNKRRHAYSLAIWLFFQRSRVQDLPISRIRNRQRRILAGFQRHLFLFHTFQHCSFTTVCLLSTVESLP
jgi:hypothetical protein